MNLKVRKFGNSLGVILPKKSSPVCTQAMGNPYSYPTPPTVHTA